MFSPVNGFSSRVDQMLMAAAKHMGYANPTAQILDDIRRAVWASQQDIYDKEDVELWLDANEYEYSDEDVRAILEYYRDIYDSELGLFRNVQRAYNAADLHLKKIDGAAREEEE